LCDNEEGVRVDADDCVVERVEGVVEREGEGGVYL